MAHIVAETINPSASPPSAGKRVESLHNILSKQYQEEDYLLLSGIQHFAFCRRQWALIHIEQQWQENVRTIEGGFMHERAHNNTFFEKRGNLLTTRGLSIASKTLGFSGNCDVVEFHKSPNGVSLFGQEGSYLPVPVEYKRGKPKEDHRGDELQLCAQGICLEEMLVCQIPKGYLYYGETKRRLEVTFDQALREEVLALAEEMHMLYARRHTPKVKTGPKCRACSLNALCLPKLCKHLSTSQYISRMLGEDEP